MKRLRSSLLVKCLLLLLSFGFGFGSAYESFALVRFCQNYSPSCETYKDTQTFTNLYFKYLERLSVYIKYRENGYQSDPKSIYTSSDLVSMLSGTADGNLKPETSVYEFTQDSFEYYNRLLNLDCRNFFYYVKNINTNEYYYSPNFESLFSKDDTLNDELLEKYLTQITEKPSYLILTTKNNLFTTNITNGTYTHSNQSVISWCTQFLQTAVTADQDTETDTQKTDNNYMIYTFLDPGYSNSNGEFVSIVEDFNDRRSGFDTAIYRCPIYLSICLLFALLFLLCTGYKKDSDKIVLGFYDRWYTELILILAVLAMIPPYMLAREITFSSDPLYQILYLLVFSYCYLVLAITITTIVKRLKAHVFISNSLIYCSLRKLYNLLIQYGEALAINTSMALLLAMRLVLYFIAQIIIYNMFYYDSASYFVFTFLALALLFWSLIRWFLDLSKIIKGTKEIVNGNLSYTIPSDHLTASMKSLANDINNIRDGLSNAVEDQMKSERLKTELITNVSHDIKTPLTSIINYVDLLQKIDLNNETAESYLKILSEKSWRLKVLIEDLVEASKASSGAIVMHPERIDIIELLKQAVGEYEDRLIAHDLEPVLTLASERMFIWADGRSTYRIIENLLSNVAKYALSKTRVYMNVTASASEAIITVKNISANKLGIESSELMERFVRGDVSRNTEGSGLGLSIANSLAALQKGTFSISIDGDLFKAILTLPLALNSDESTTSSESTTE